MAPTTVTLEDLFFSLTEGPDETPSTPTELEEVPR
jgi:hypothetical protein